MHTKRISISLILGFLLSLGCYAQIQLDDVEKRVQAFGLDTIRAEGIIIYFDPSDSLRAQEFADLSVSMAKFYKLEFDLGFKFKVAALKSKHWFSEFPGVPYAIPWLFFPDRIIMMPSSLNEGTMINKKRNRQENRWFVDFVLLHEYAHFLEKDYFRPLDKNNYLGVNWFSEFIANYFAYAYIHSTNTKWVDGAKKLWKENLRAYTPQKFTLDWSFMNNLPPQELGPTYGWYQIMLNLKAAELYEKYGLDFLRTLKERLPWQDSENWSTESLLSLLEDISPGFVEWSKSIESYAKEIDE